MSLAVLSIGALHYFWGGDLPSVLEPHFVEAADDATFESDKLYTDYIKSAEMQKELMI